MIKNCALENELRQVIEEVNRTLSIYEVEYISVPRYTESERECISSFEQFIEARFNYECRNIPELSDLIRRTEGHLFFCTRLDEPDEKRRRFKTAYLMLLQPEMLYDSDKYLIEDLERVKNLIGGTIVQFTCVKKKFKLTIN